MPARYAEAGADVVFVEAPESREELLSLPTRLPGVPQVVNLVEGGRTPALPLAELGEFRVALYANLALQAAVRGMQTALGRLAATGSLTDAAGDVAGWQERQRLVRKPEHDELERRYRA